MPLTDKQWTGLARDFHRALTRVAPGWTDAGPHDPGVTVLELMARVLTDLQSRSNALDPQARMLARCVAEHASALATSSATVPDNSDCSGALQRVNYLSGMLPVANSNPPDTTAGDATTQATRIAETFRATLATAPAVDAVVLARLRQVRGRWRVDARFKPVRAVLAPANPQNIGSPPTRKQP